MGVANGWGIGVTPVEETSEEKTTDTDAGIEGVDPSFGLSFYVAFSQSLFK